VFAWQGAQDKSELYDNIDENMKSNLPRKLLLAYVAFIIYGTTIPFAFERDPNYLQEKFADFLGDPLRLEQKQGFSLPDIVSNVLLFMPFGFLFSYAVSQPRFGRTLLGATLAGILASGFVECLQFFAPTRTVSLQDLITNASGAFIGAALGVAFRRYFHERVLNYTIQQLHASPDKALFALYAALLVFWQLAPFDVTIDVSTLKKAVKSISLALPATRVDFGNCVAHAIPFAFFSFLWLIALADGRHWRGIIPAILVTTLVAVGIEFSQLFIVSHTTKLVDVLAGLIGGIYGAVLCASVWLREKKNNNLFQRQIKQTAMTNLGLTHWLIYLLLVELSPFNFASTSLAERLDQFRWLPYVEYYTKTGVMAVLDFGAGVLQYALFAVLVMERRRHRQRLIADAELIPLMVMAFILSVSMEFAQLFLASRFSGITDCLNSVIGVLAGYWLWRQAQQIFAGDDRRSRQMEKGSRATKLQNAPSSFRI